MCCKRFLASTLAALSLAVLWLHGGHILGLAAEPAFDTQTIRVDITINYVNHIAHTPLDAQFAAQSWKAKAATGA